MHAGAWLANEGSETSSSGDEEEGIVDFVLRRLEEMGASQAFIPRHAFVEEACTEREMELDTITITETLDGLILLGMVKEKNGAVKLIEDLRDLQS